MGKLSLSQLVVVAAHALMLWVLCGVLMFAGMSLVPLDYALVIHAIGAPIITILISWVYFKQFHYTTPLVTAFLFVGIVIFMDFFVVALLIEQSFAMFASFIGTWLPFALIFMATYGAGHYLSHQSGTAKVV
ncbi:MAG TPA: hypothetical protein VEC93_10785 [Anaerolineae bacterium]|nr:hypothetical protein [Anaerolineae bacterium]